MARIPGYGCECDVGVIYFGRLPTPVLGLCTFNAIVSVMSYQLRRRLEDVCLCTYATHRQHSV